jgi:predicted hydrocarbon binding protein
MVITREEANRIMSIEGKTRGISIRGDLEFVKFKEGNEGLNKLRKEMEKVGYFPDPKMKAMDFCPLGLELLTLLMIKQLFNYGEKEFYEMGEFSSRLSLILRLFMKYFVSVNAISGQASEIWRRYYTVGNFKVISIDEQKRTATLRLENFKLHELHCQNVRGYISNIIKMILNKKVNSKETKCPFRGDDYHEFVLTW